MIAKVASSGFHLSKKIVFHSLALTWGMRVDIKWVSPLHFHITKEKVKAESRDWERDSSHDNLDVSCSLLEVFFGLQLVAIRDLENEIEFPYDVATNNRMLIV